MAKRPDAARLAVDLLHWCQRTGQWGPDATDKPLVNFLEAFSELPGTQSVFDWQSAFIAMESVLTAAKAPEGAVFAERDGQQLKAWDCGYFTW